MEEEEESEVKKIVWLSRPVSREDLRYLLLPGWR